MNDSSDSINEDNSGSNMRLLERDSRAHTVISDPNKLLNSLDNDQEYESRKGVASFFQKIFRKKRTNQSTNDISSKV